MPRPLIIKIDSHKSQPNKKATGSIDIQLIKGLNNKGRYYETYNNSETDNAFLVSKDEQEESGSPSIVRNLISRYETSPNLIKYKSKSLVNLQTPQMSAATKKTQDDFLYNKNKYNNEEAANQKFDFKKVFLKFETSNQQFEKQTANFNHYHHTKNYNISKYNNDPIDFNSIKQKARVLLEQRDSHEDSSWHDQVIELLQKIDNLSFNTFTTQEFKSNSFKKPEEIKKPSSLLIYKEENSFEKTKNLDENEFNKNIKVREIKNMFENTKSDTTKNLSRSVSSYATYFGVKPEDVDNTQFIRTTYSGRSLSATPFNEDFNNNEMEMEKSEESELSDEESDVIEGHRIISQPILASSMKIQELKNFFESDSDKYVPFDSYTQNSQPEETDKPTNIFNDSETEDVHVVENRMLPPPTMIILKTETDGNANVENAKQRIQEITKDIEDYEQQINSLVETDKAEGSYINELLIRVLIKLDGIKTYGNEVILTERRKAIQFCTNCITKLGEKIKGEK